MKALEEEIKRFESWQKLEDLFEYAANYNIHIKLGLYRDRNKQGIHLIEPDYNELSEAIGQAASNMQDTIWYHDKIQYQLTLIQGKKSNE